MKLIGNGAEAELYLNPKDSSVVKRRVKKGYRISEIDNALRKQRTRREAKILDKIGELGPGFVEVDDGNKEVLMNYLEGPMIKDVLDKKNKIERNKIMKLIGNSVAKLHALNVIHGDLTTSNMILVNEQVKLIDFGLSFVTDKIEHKAVDIHLLKHALESKHYQHFESLFESFLEGYKENPEFNEVMKRFEIVEKRGRYKRRLGS